MSREQRLDIGERHGFLRVEGLRWAPPGAAAAVAGTDVVGARRDAMICPSCFNCDWGTRGHRSR
jgi:hypothetical protein